MKKIPQYPTEGLSDTNDILKVIEKKLPISYVIDDEPVYILRLSGVEVDVIHELINAWRKS